MSRKAKSSRAPSDLSESPASGVSWKFTKVMNMRDLSRDDDYLSHIFVEKLGNLGSSTPISVHKMDPLRRLPKTDAMDILAIVQRLIRAKPNGAVAVKQAVNELLLLHSVQYFLKEYEQSQINAFATHASRYLELFVPSGSIEIAQTSRYSKWTGKSELCIVATCRMPPGHIITELKGSMADLTEEEDRELKRTGPRNDGGARRDFSVIHSKQLKKNHLFLGPARFVNHDCEHNAELFRSGKYITFRAIKPIAPGQEITAHYGDGYFGRNNRHCLCESCERNGKGGYTIGGSEDDTTVAYESDFDSDGDLISDSETSSTSSAPEVNSEPTINLNERRTRRGVYHLALPEVGGSDESDGDDEGDTAIASTISVTSATVNGNDVDTASSSTLIGPSRLARMANTQKSPMKSVITTRGQKAREASSASSASQLTTPPLSSTFGAASMRGCEQVLWRNRKSEPIVTLTNATTKRSRGRPRKSIDETLIDEKQPELAIPDGRPHTGTIFRKTARASIRSKTIIDVCQSPGPPRPMYKVMTRTQPLSPTRKFLRLPIRDTQPNLTAKKGPIAVKPTKATNLSQAEKPVVPSEPLCVTCASPLPVPLSSPSSTASKRNKGKGKVEAVKEDCTRCKRHFLIYNAPWPQRVPNPGSAIISAPRECTPVDHGGRATHLKGADEAKKRAREVEDERTAKKRKITPQAALQKSASRVIGRTRLPSLKSRDGSGPVVKMEVTEINLSGALDAKRHLSLSHKRGRDGYGEGGILANESIATLRTARAKRARKSAPNVPYDPDVPGDEPLDPDGRRDKTFWPCLPLPPNGLGMKRLGSLNGRPNPFCVSRWRSSYGESTPTLVDDNDTDDNISDHHPATPESGANDIVMKEQSVRSPSGFDIPPPESDSDDDVVEVSASPKILSVSTFKGLGLFSKPSPVELARRIWAPSALVTDSLEDEPTSPLRRAGLKSAITSPQSLASLRSKLNTEFLFSRSDYSDDDDDGRDIGSSSGEEDIILPGPTDSNFYKLQSSVTFKPTDAASLSSTIGLDIRSGDGSDVRAGTPLSPAPNFSGAAGISPAFSRAMSTSSIEKESLGKGLPELSSSMLRVLGPLRSDFISSASPIAGGRKPSFVHAGWESDSSS